MGTIDNQVGKILCSLWEVDHAAIGNSCQWHHWATGFVGSPAIMIADGTYDIDTNKNIGYADYIGDCLVGGPRVGTLHVFWGATRQGHVMSHC